MRVVRRVDRSVRASGESKHTLARLFSRRSLASESFFFFFRPQACDRGAQRTSPPNRVRRPSFPGAYTCGAKRSAWSWDRERGAALCRAGGNTIDGCVCCVSLATMRLPPHLPRPRASYLPWMMQTRHMRGDAGGDGVRGFPVARLRVGFLVAAVRVRPGRRAAALAASLLSGDAVGGVRPAVLTRACTAKTISYPCVDGVRASGVCNVRHGARGG